MWVTFPFARFSLLLLRKISIVFPLVFLIEIFYHIIGFEIYG